MAKYGERISGRPSYQTHRQTYYPSAGATGGALNCEAEASGSGGVGVSVGGGQGARLNSSGGNSSGTISQRDPVYPRSLAEEVLWRQRRFAWWGTTYLVDPVSVPPQLHPNPAQLKAQKILQQIRNKDVSYPLFESPVVVVVVHHSLLPFCRWVRCCGEKKRVIKYS